ncbi:hypothetical protein QTP88_022133 [Uroleucon formosanum]
MHLWRLEITAGRRVASGYRRQVIGLPATDTSTVIATCYKSDVLVLQDQDGRRAVINCSYTHTHTRGYNSSDVEMTAHVSADVPCTIRFKRGQQHEEIAAVLYGAPPHWKLEVRRYLNGELLQRWIGRKGNGDLAIHPWPPRFPDLTVCDFFLFGYVKEKVYVPPLATNLEELEIKIKDAVNAVTPDMMSNVWVEFDYLIDDVGRPGSTTSCSLQASIVKLASLKVPEFGGNYKEWSTFKDMFSAMVHSNEEVKEVQKFFCLKAGQQYHSIYQPRFDAVCHLVRYCCRMRIDANPRHIVRGTHDDSSHHRYGQESRCAICSGKLFPGRSPVDQLRSSVAILVRFLGFREKSDRDICRRSLGCSESYRRLYVCRGGFARTFSPTGRADTDRVGDGPTANVPDHDLTPADRDEKLSAAKADTTEKTFKYWKKRFAPFSMFDKGVLLDEEFLLNCPELLASYMANKCGNIKVAVDPFSFRKNERCGIESYKSYLMDIDRILSVWPAGTGLLFNSRVSRRMTREQSVTNNNNEKPIMLIPTLE